MRHSLLHSAALCSLVALISLPVVPSRAAAAEPSPRFASDQVDRYIQQYELVTLDTRELAARVAASEPIRIEAGLESFEIALVPNDLRAEGYRAVETAEDGTMRDLPAQPVTTYAGDVLNHEGAIARFTIDERGVQGLIIDGEDKVFVEPLLNYSLAAGPTDYLVYHASDVRPDFEPGTCGTTAAHKVAEAVEGVAGEASKQGSLLTCQIATETDNEYAAALGSTSAANAEALSIVNQVDGVYEAEVGISFEVTFQSTYSGSDPYSATSSASSLLGELRNYWNANRASVQRDVVHMFTGKDMDGSTIGIAYVGVVCNATSYSYGISQRWTGSPQKFVLTAHEIGHNFNACHSDTSCNPTPSACSNTIMQSFVGTGFTFCTFSRGQITGHAGSNSSCLGATTVTPPAAPSSLSASAVSTSQINLSWSDNSTNESGFKIERKTGTTGTWAQIAAVGAGVTSYSNLGLAGGTTYVYRVRSTNSAGDSLYSNEASATTATSNIPAAPTSLAADTISRTRIDLSWTDNAGNESGYKVERSTDGANFSQIASVGPNVTFYASTGLRRNRTYYYRVRAYNASGDSTYSNTASARTLRARRR